MLSMLPWTWSAFAKRWLLLGLCFCPWQLLLFRCQLGPGVETQWLTVTRLILEQLMDCNHCDYTPGPVGTASWESMCSTSWWLAWWKRGLQSSHNQASSLSDHQADEPWSSLFWDKLATSAFGRNVVPPLLGSTYPHVNPMQSVASHYWKRKVPIFWHGIYLVLLTYPALILAPSSVVSVIRVEFPAESDLLPAVTRLEGLVLPGSNFCIHLPSTLHPGLALQ